MINGKQFRSYCDYHNIQSSERNRMIEYQQEHILKDEALDEKSQNLQMYLPMKPFYFVRLSDNITNGLFYKFVTRDSYIRTKEALLIGEDKRPELVALRAYLNNDKLDFVQMPISKNKYVGVYLGENDDAWTTDPEYINPAFPSKTEPSFYIMNLGIYTDLKTFSPNITIETEIQHSFNYSDSDVPFTLCFWKNNPIENCVLFHDHLDVVISGLSYYSTSCERELQIKSSSKLRETAALRAVFDLKNTNPIELLNLVGSRLPLDRVNIEPLLRDLLVTFSYHQPLNNNLPPIPKLDIAKHVDLDWTFYSQSQSMTSYLVQEIISHTKDEGVFVLYPTLLFDGKRDANSYSAVILNKTSIKYIVVVSHKLNCFFLCDKFEDIQRFDKFCETNVEACEQAVVAVHTKPDYGYHCVYNNIVWGVQTREGFLALYPTLGYSFKCMYDNIKYLTSPFMTSTQVMIDDFCAGTVSWKVGSLYLVPTYDQTYIVLPNLCESSTLKVKDSPFMSKGATLFFDFIRKNYTEIETLFKTEAEMNQHFQNILGHIYVVYFYTRRNRSLAPHNYSALLKDVYNKVSAEVEVFDRKPPILKESCTIS